MADDPQDFEPAGQALGGTHVTIRSRIPLRARDGSVRAWATVDPCEFAPLNEITTWHLHGQGYAAGRINGKSWLMHRWIVGLAAGNPLVVDHANGDRLDNRWSNLIVCSSAENSQNHGPRAGGTSRHRGVSWSAQHGRWQAHYFLNGRSHYCGLFDDEDDAARAVSLARSHAMPHTQEDRHVV